ncbi:pyridoxamine 5'-phosphate oxidase family protein [Streptomyces spiralis]|uniref:pyridoxamine 5'-phosphate oxidase family protein n=1 Tax=Streptomyces spiralis TaxID=66376 RepID=UPI0036C3FC6E
MHAHLGDRLVVESPVTGVTRRDGEIVGLHHDDGTPPYDVRWSDTGEISLVFPGPDAHVQHAGHGADVEHTDHEADVQHTGHEADARDMEHEGDVRRPGREGAPARGPTAAGPAVGTAGKSGDFGRRLAAARRRQGLSLEETAGRARMSPQYLAYLEQHPSEPGITTILRLADALGTTLLALRGGDQEFPPGQGRALLHPRLTDLSRGECRALLSTHGVGRIAFTGPDGPVAFPVNYDVLGEALYFRSTPGSAPVQAVGSDVAFEVDHLDEAMSQGWSVLAVGRAEVVDDPDMVRRLEERAYSEPWAGGSRLLWVKVPLTRLTGRRITPADR